MLSSISRDIINKYHYGLSNNSWYMSKLSKYKLELCSEIFKRISEILVYECIISESKFKLEFRPGGLNGNH